MTIPVYLASMFGALAIGLFVGWGTGKCDRIYGHDLTHFEMASALGKIECKSDGSVTMEHITVIAPGFKDGDIEDVGRRIQKAICWSPSL